MACQNLCLKNWDKKATIGSGTYLLGSGVVSSIIEVACSINSNILLCIECISRLYLSTVFLNIIWQSLQLTYGGHHISDVCGEFAGILSLVQQLH